MSKKVRVVMLGIAILAVVSSILLYITVIQGYSSTWINENILNSLNLEKEYSIKLGTLLFFVSIITIGITTYISLKQKYPHWFVIKTSKSKEEKTIQKMIVDFSERMKRHSYVIGVQLYSYNINRANDEIQIKYVDGDCSEEENMKAFIHHRFKFERGSLLQFEKGLKESIEEQNYRSLYEFYKIMKKETEIAYREGKAEKMVNCYSIMLLIAQYGLRNKKDWYMNRHVEPAVNSTLIQKINEHENTGLARAILNAELTGYEYYAFDNMSSGSKNGRIYLSFKIENQYDLRGPHIILITLSDIIKTKLRETEQEEVIGNVVAEFEEILVSNP